MPKASAHRNSSRAPRRTRYADPERVAAVRRALAGRHVAASVADIFQALADPTRVTILQALSIASLCNRDLALVLGLSESAISHQMRDLRLMKLVTRHRSGRMVYYELPDAHVRHVLDDTLRHVMEGESA